MRAWIDVRDDTLARARLAERFGIGPDALGASRDRNVNLVAAAPIRYVRVMIGATIALLPVVVAEHHLAVDALTVLEILGPREWVAIPNTPPMLRGAVAWRGRAVGLFDLGPIWALPPLAAPHTRARNVAVRVGDETIVMTVDGVLELREVEADAITPVHATRWIVERGLPCRGETAFDGAVIPILDLEAWANAQRGPR
jgi:chemotaxis signal transduction protein